MHVIIYIYFMYFHCIVYFLSIKAEQYRHDSTGHGIGSASNNNMWTENSARIHQLSDAQGLNYYRCS